eukprot:TRINITY_DN62996_c0_g1_i1.p1 TRINITY_DN62996_c0_g1~~TRINITY_DN62996_c0_g1_i1.p1  ORF type:complete len:697 (-),score=90.15 TRINITY_DN62996_c0_g1_i1:35-2125(-)
MPVTVDVMDSGSEMGTIQSSTNATHATAMATFDSSATAVAVATRQTLNGGVTCFSADADAGAGQGELHSIPHKPNCEASCLKSERDFMSSSSVCNAFGEAVAIDGLLGSMQGGVSGRSQPQNFEFQSRTSLPQSSFGVPSSDEGEDKAVVSPISPASSYSCPTTHSFMLSQAMQNEFSDNSQGARLNPRRQFRKYTVLMVYCFFTLGPYFQDAAFDASKVLIGSSLFSSKNQIILLSVVGSSSGLLCLPVWGFVSRMSGVRVARLASFTCLLVGLVIVAGCTWSDYGLVLVARCLFRTALNVLLLMQTVVAYSTFSGDALTMAVSLIVCAMRFGSMLGYVSSGPLLDQLGLVDALLFTEFLVVLTFIVALCFALITRERAAVHSERLLDSTQASQVVFTFDLLYIVPTCAWATAGAIGCLNACVFPFEAIAADILVRDFAYGRSEAGFLVSLVPAVSVLAPFLAPRLAKTTLQHFIAACCGFVLLGASHMAFSLRGSSVLFPIFITLGIGYVVASCSLWVALPDAAAANVGGARGNRTKDVEWLSTGVAIGASAVAETISNVFVGTVASGESFDVACVWFVGVAAAGLLLVCAAMATHVSSSVGASQAQGMLRSDGGSNSNQPVVVVYSPRGGVAAPSSLSACDVELPNCVQVLGDRHGNGSFLDGTFSVDSTPRSTPRGSPGRPPASAAMRRSDL